MAMIYCPECNSEIDENVAVCPCCAFPIKGKIAETKILEVSTQIIDPEKQKKKKLIGVAMCIIGCICWIVAITRITNEDYKFYIEHYEDCMDGYEDCMEQAKYAGFLSGSYISIARSYEDMAKDDMKEIWKYRGTAIVCCIAGIGLVFVGYKISRRVERYNGTDKMSGMWQRKSFR